jgi:hypothetical protein
MSDPVKEGQYTKPIDKYVINRKMVDINIRYEEGIKRMNRVHLVVSIVYAVLVIATLIAFIIKFH